MSITVLNYRKLYTLVIKVSHFSSEKVLCSHEEFRARINGEGASEEQESLVIYIICDPPQKTNPADSETFQADGDIFSGIFRKIDLEF